MAKAASTRRVPALIVGGGPVGLYASSLLSAYGVPSLLAERAANGKSHPRAHLINTRSMELLRELGVERQIREQTPPMDEWRHFRYCTSVLGTQIAAQDHMAGREWAALSEMTPSPMAHLSQPKLEAILRAEAERRALGGTELLSGYECVSFAQHGGGVTAQLRRVVSPAASASYGARYSAVGTGADADAAPDALTVEADYLLACDGAHSRVRQALGLRLRGPAPLQHFKSVHFVAPALAPLLRERGLEAMLYFCFNRGAVAVLVAHNISQGEWVAQLPFFPGLQDAEALDRAACTAGIAACLGTLPTGHAATPPSPFTTTSSSPSSSSSSSSSGSSASSVTVVPFEVKSIGSWAMSSKVIERLSLGRGGMQVLTTAPPPLPHR
jgi:2-polyprenyl-6-methoxyphenol hydroxylase-like FAD-dependent oxidoreductase